MHICPPTQHRTYVYCHVKWMMSMGNTDALWGGFFERTNRRVILKNWPRSQTHGHHPKPHTSLPHGRFIGCCTMSMSHPKPQCSEIRTAAMKSLQRREGKFNEVHLISYSKKNISCGNPVDCQQTFTLKVACFFGFFCLDFCWLVVFF